VNLLPEINDSFSREYKEDSLISAIAILLIEREFEDGQNGRYP